MRTAEVMSHYEAKPWGIRPDYAEAHFGLGVALAEDPARLPEAIVHFEEAVRLKPDFTEAQISLANALAGDPVRLNEAIAHYESALRLQPDYAEVYYNLANALATDPGRVPEAISHYEQALKVNPEDPPEAHTNLAILLARDPRRQPEVVSHFESAVRLKPDSAEARNEATEEGTAGQNDRATFPVSPDGQDGAGARAARLHAQGRGRRLELGTRPWLMGIVNASPDSFSDGGLHVGLGGPVRSSRGLLADGAESCDIGGESA